MDTVINLEVLNDHQKTLLTQISYLDINDEGRKKIAEGGLLVSELYQYLENPNTLFVGDAGLGENNTQQLTDKVLGENNYITKAQVLTSLIQNGLGNLKITDISEKQKAIDSGFQALTFKDTFGNTGISYRGSDFDLSQGGASDWLEADMLEYFTGTSRQREEALEYFNKNKNAYGNNFVYGHSLGGNLTSHTYLENYESIKEAFTINGNPINQKMLDTPEKIEAFNSSKYNCNIICGDIVGHFKSCELYKNNIHFIQNNESMKDSFISAHLVQSASYSANGNFIYATEQEMIDKMGPNANNFMHFIQNIRENLNNFEHKITKADKKEQFNQYKEDITNHFKNIFNKFKFKRIELSQSELLEKFHLAASRSEQEFISQISIYLQEVFQIEEEHTIGGVTK